MSARRNEVTPPPDVVAGVPLEPATTLPRTQSDRRAGIIVTAEHENGPPQISFHIGGAPRAALLAACERIDRLGGGWFIVSLSSPASIYRDLQGTRLLEPSSYRISTNMNDPKRYAADPRTTELQLLGGIGRLDLLRPFPFRQAAPA